MPVDLEPYTLLVPAWLMVLFRLTGIFVFTPLFSSRMLPPRIKVLLALSMSFCVFPMLLAAGKTSSYLMVGFLDTGLSLWGLVPAVGGELLIGMIIGYAAILPLIGMQLGGRVISQQLGLGLAEVFNPGEEQSGLVSQFLYLLALAIFLLVGGHRVLLNVLVGSFDHIPLGGTVAVASAMDMIVGLLGAAFGLALRVAGPLLCLIFLETVTLGFIARTVPQLNILSVGFALRILVGASVLIGSVGIAAGVFTDMLQDMLGQLRWFFGN